MLSSREFSQPRSPTFQANSLPSEPPGIPKNIGMGSLFLLQGIFPAQESNRGLLHCRWVLYQLSYQGLNTKNSSLLFEMLTIPQSQGLEEGTTMN